MKRALAVLSVVVVLGACGPVGEVGDATTPTPTSGSTMLDFDDQPDVTVTTVVSGTTQDEVVTEAQLEELETVLDEVETLLDDTEKLMDEPLP